MTSLTTGKAQGVSPHAANSDESLARRWQFHLSLAAVAVMFSYRVFIPRMPTMDLSLQRLPMLMEAGVLMLLTVFAAIRLPGVLRRGGWVERLLIGFATFVVVTCLWTPGPIYALSVAGKLAVTIVLVLDAAQRARSAQQLRWVLYAVGIGVALHVVLPWIHLAFPASVQFHYNGRMIHTWISPTNWSVLAAALTLLCLFAVDRTSGRRRLAWWAGAVLGVVTVWLSMGKTGLVALPVGIGIFAILAGRRTGMNGIFAGSVGEMPGRLIRWIGGWRWKVIGEFAAVMLLVAAPIFALYPPVMNYWASYLGNPRFIFGLSGRLVLWESLAPNDDVPQAAPVPRVRKDGRKSRSRTFGGAASAPMRAAADDSSPAAAPDALAEPPPAAVDLPRGVPLLVGHGYTAMRQVPVQASGNRWASRNAHNAYLGVWYETGAVGLLLVLVMIGATVRSLWGVSQRSGDLDQRRLAAETAGLLTTLLVAGMFMDLFGGMPRAESLLLWPVVAVAASLYRLHQMSSPRTRGDESVDPSRPLHHDT